MEKLTPKQRAHLKSLAHPLKPILQIGKEGITHAVLQTITDAFRTRELIKVKVLEASPDDPQDAAQTLAEQLDQAHVVQVIGRTIVLYHRHPEEPEILLPG